MNLKQIAKKYLPYAAIGVACILLLVIMGVRTGGGITQVLLPTPPVSQSDSAASAVTIPQQAILNTEQQANPDAVAWLRIPGTEIDNVIMQTTNNDLYLVRDERGEPNPWGCLFADYYARLTSADSLTQNTVLYGHTSMQEDPNGQRFSQLFKYLELDFVNENRNIFFTLDNNELVFEIFAVFYSDIDFYYIDPTPSDQGFDSFLQEVNSRNEYIFEGMQVTEQDKLLTLSGCGYRYDEDETGDHRFVVMAKLVTDPDTSTPVEISHNPSPKRP